MVRAIFLDRDGTINEDPGYLSRPEQFVFFPHSLEGLQRMQAEGYLLVVITNQSGIARGYFTTDDLANVHSHMQEKLGQDGIHLAGIYYCPHHPEKGQPPYVKQCACRKPGIGLLERAAAELQIDLCHSWMIGDKKSDILAGQKAGCQTILVLTGEGENTLQAGQCKPDLVAEDLLAAFEKMKGMRGCANGC